MKKRCMLLPLDLILCFMVGCQDKEAMAELEAYKTQAQNGQMLVNRISKSDIVRIE